MALTRKKLIAKAVRVSRSGMLAKSIEFYSKYALIVQQIDKIIKKVAYSKSLTKRDYYWKTVMEDFYYDNIHRKQTRKLTPCNRIIPPT